MLMEGGVDLLSRSCRQVALLERAGEGEVDRGVAIARERVRLGAECEGPVKIGFAECQTGLELNP